MELTYDSLSDDMSQLPQHDMSRTAFESAPFPCNPLLRYFKITAHGLPQANFKWNLAMHSMAAVKERDPGPISNTKPQPDVLLSHHGKTRNGSSI